MPGFNYGGGVGDGTNWSSERGDTPNPGSSGNSGNQSGNGAVVTDIMRPGASYNTPYGKVTINREGHAVMNGIVMTADNSSLVSDGAGGITRVPNSMLTDKRPTWYGGNKTDVEKTVEARMSVAGSIEAGVFPTGYLLENGKVGTIQSKYRFISSGHGEGTYVRNGTQFVEIPELTAAYAAGSAAVKFTADFYKELTAHYGQNASALAQEFAAKAKGKTIRSVDQALAAYDRYRGSLGNKFSAKDRAAIVAALNSRTYADMATSLNKYSRAMGFVGTAIDTVDTFIELKKAFQTDNWRPFFVKIEALTAGKAAAAITAFTFAALTGLSLGIIGYALIMALVGALVDDALMNSINSRLGI